MKLIEFISLVLSILQVMSLFLIVLGKKTKLVLSLIMIGGLAAVINAPIIDKPSAFVAGVCGIGIFAFAFSDWPKK